MTNGLTGREVDELVGNAVMMAAELSFLLNPRQFYHRVAFHGGIWIRFCSWCKTYQGLLDVVPDPGSDEHGAVTDGICVACAEAYTTKARNQQTEAES